MHPITDPGDAYDNHHHMEASSRARMRDRVPKLSLLNPKVEENRFSALLS